MNLHSLLKTAFYRAGYSVKRLRPAPNSWSGTNSSSVADVSQMLHKVNPYEAFNFAEYPLDLHGWGGESPVFAKLIHEVKPSLIVEVGTWKGASAVTMAMAAKETGLATKVVCIDTWLGALEFWMDQSDPERFGSLNLRHGYPTVYYQFLANVCHKGLQNYIVPFPQTSALAALWLRTYNVRADLIYIDASHEEEDVYGDLLSYWEILGERGIMFGDDYGWDGVRLAVDRFVREVGRKVEIDADKWLVRKA